jgi:hypothetical protein
MIKTSVPKRRKWFAFASHRLEGTLVMRKRDQLNISYISRREMRRDRLEIS